MIILLSGFAVILCGCSYTKFVMYTSQDYPSTNRLDVYTNVSEIKRPYKVIGNAIESLYLIGGGKRNPYVVFDALRTDAMKKGANAICIDNLTYYGKEEKAILIKYIDASEGIIGPLAK